MATETDWAMTRARKLRGLLPDLDYEREWTPAIYAALVQARREGMEAAKAAAEHYNPHVVDNGTGVVEIIGLAKRRIAATIQSLIDAEVTPPQTGRDEP